MAQVNLYLNLHLLQYVHLDKVYFGLNVMGLEFLGSYSPQAGCHNPNLVEHMREGEDERIFMPETDTRS